MEKQEKPKTKSRLAREVRQEELAQRTLLIRPAPLKDGMPRRMRRALAAGEKAQARQVRTRERELARLRYEAAKPAPHATDADLRRQERREAAIARREAQRQERIYNGRDRATLKASRAHLAASAQPE